MGSTIIKAFQGGEASVATEIEKILESLVFQEATAFIEKDERNTIEQQLELVQIPAFSGRAGLKS